MINSLLQFKSEYSLPENFWWGTSLAAHQAEGANHNSWTDWEKLPGKIAKGETSERACDHWNLYEKDFDLLVGIGGNTHRFSLEWSRLEPVRGEWNQEAVQHYRKMIQALRQRHIRPVLCLFHFTLPTWAEAAGGFENPLVGRAFGDFATKCQESFGDLCQHWLSLNEPSVYALGGYGIGVMPPGVHSLKRSLKVMVALLKLHGVVYQNLKRGNPQNQVGWAHHMRVFTPRTRLSPFSQGAAWVADNVMNWFWLDAIQTGHIKLFVPGLISCSETSENLCGAMDFLGINYYGRDMVTFNPMISEKIHLSVHPNGVLTDVNWEVFPEGLGLLLEGIQQRGLNKYPVLITENGLADAKDHLRAQFIYDHMRVFLGGCERLGLKPLGYLHWSLIDNFEWISGYDPRFGLFEVDYATQRRTARPSAFYFSQIGRTGRVSPPSSEAGPIAEPRRVGQF